MKKVGFVLFVLVLVFTAQKESAYALEKGLLFYLPFEESTKNAVNNQDGIAKNVVLKEGKIGKGAYFDKGSYLRFPAIGNINYRQGTVEFWVKPNWNGDDGIHHYFFAGNITDARNVNSFYVSKKNYQGGVIMGQMDSKADEKGVAIQEAAVPGGKDLTPTSVRNWKEGEWHHIAYSWDDKSGKLKIYIDGLLRATNDNRRVTDQAFPSSYEAYVNIGSSIDEVAFAESIIDELKVWNYPLSDIEIAKIAGLSELGKSPIGRKKSESGKKEQFNPITIVGIFSLVGLLLFWKRNALSRIWRKREF